MGRMRKQVPISLQKTSYALKKEFSAAIKSSKTSDIGVSHSRSLGVKDRSDQEATRATLAAWSGK